MRNLNILLIFGYPLDKGGHFKCAMNLTSHFVAEGHKVFVVSKPGGVGEIIEEYKQAGFRVYPNPRMRSVGTLPVTFGASYTAQLARKLEIDIIHAQDSASAGTAYFAAIRSNIPFVVTQPGGGFRYDRPPDRAAVVLYSDELMTEFKNHYPWLSANFSRIRARIDTRFFGPADLEEAVSEKYGLPRRGFKIVLATRFDVEKNPWLDTLATIARSAAVNGADLKIIVAGWGKIGGALKAMASEINSETAGDPVIYPIGMVNNTQHMVHLYNYADIVVGNGRGILEAMACRKPVAVLGPRGEAELVRPDNVDDVAYYNFSGRHFDETSSSAESVFDTLISLLNNKERYQQLADFSRGYIVREMDSHRGARELLDVYKKAGGTGPGTLMDGVKWYCSAFKNKLVYAIKCRIDKTFRLLSKIREGHSKTSAQGLSGRR